MCPAPAQWHSEAAPPTCYYSLLPADKYQAITSWCLDVERCCDRDGSSATEPLIDLTDDFLQSNHCNPEVWQIIQQRQEGERALEVDRQSYTADGDKRLYDLPHPEANPLLCAEKDMIVKEYLRVLRHWNEFEEEKWEAEKVFRKTRTPEALHYLMEREVAVGAAGAAARYIELHATQYRLPIDFEALFFNYYRIPTFYLNAPDNTWDTWIPGLDDFTPPCHQQPPPRVESWPSATYTTTHQQQPMHYPNYDCDPSPQWTLYTPPPVYSHPIQE